MGRSPRWSAAARPAVSRSAGSSATRTRNRAIVRRYPEVVAARFPWLFGRSVEAPERARRPLE